MEHRLVYTRILLQEGITMSSEVQTIDLGFVNCYLVRADGGFFLVDTGLPVQRGALEKRLLDAGCRPGDLRLVVLTHGDLDHTGNCVYLREKYRTRIAMHREDSDLAKNAEVGATRKVKSPLLRLMMRVGRRSGAASGLSPELRHFQPDVYLVDGDGLREYGLDAQVLHLPGHTNGSIGILTHDGELFAGDTLENRRSPGPASIIAREDLLASSLLRLSKLAITTVYPGHGKPFAWEQFVRPPSR
jgi:hydroxyacylglutathione hydrolase